ncbi:MAG TPA: TAXI family TRAP transporter solute-binding subunit [Spirochaetia bacterium]|nr:TAXI family TRAP transporter solute-binding subunit [Spirochaetales bacterium]HRW24895.1 TAXI family TRAP transporter solute-binding subunit [Spirochaetia bacterium]
MKKISVLLIALALVAALSGCGAPKQSFVSIASGGTGGTYYPLAGAMATIWNEGVKGMNATAQATGASVANVNLLREGKADVIMVQNDIAYYAVNGLELFKDKAYPDLKGMAILYPETCQLITLANSGIKAVNDLKGKKVAVGAAGSGVEANARQIMEAAGITYADIQVQYLSFNEAASNLKDGNIDAAFLTAGYPTAAVQDISATKDINVVSIGDAVIAKLQSTYPFYTKATIPAGTYKGVDFATQTVAVQAMLAVSSSLDAATVEKMLQTMFSASGSERLTAAHAKAGAMIKLENAQAGMSLPLHPGAEKFYGKK